MLAGFFACFVFSEADFQEAPSDLPLFRIDVSPGDIVIHAQNGAGDHNSEFQIFSSRNVQMPRAGYFLQCAEANSGMCGLNEMFGHSSPADATISEVWSCWRKLVTEAGFKSLKTSCHVVCSLFSSSGSHAFYPLQ